MIYFIRHGKTVLNSKIMVQGFTDSPLTELGVEQAVKLGKGLADIPFVTAYCGEVGRQHKTAQLILQQNNNEVPSIVETIGFNEWNFGGFEGKSDLEMWTPIFENSGFTVDETWSQYEALFEKVGGNRGISDAIAANDETGTAEKYDDILARAKASINLLIEQSLASGGGNVLVVSSGCQIATILDMLTGRYNGENMENCSVTIVKYSRGIYILESINDTGYLEMKEFNTLYFQK